MTREQEILLKMAKKALSADAVNRKAKCCPIAETCMSIDCPVSSEYIGRPSADAVQVWNNHEVACMLAELFGDACACNYNCIDEWLPMVCDFKDNCPNTVGVACWEQFLKHYGERRKYANTD